MYQDFAGKVPKPFSPISKHHLDIGGALLSFMQERKIDGASLSRLSGVSESEIYNILKNRRTRAGLKTLSKLAEPLGRTLADIFVKLAHEQEGNAKKLDKDPVFAAEYKKEGIMIFSDIPPCPEMFIGKMALAGGSKGFSSDGLKENCWIFMRVNRGALEVECARQTYPLTTYQKIIFNGRYRHTIKNKSGIEPTEVLLITAPSFWTVSPA